MYWKALLIWFTLMVLAIINGAVRVSFQIPWWGEQSGHVVSTLSLCLLILLAAWSSITWIGPEHAAQTLNIGLLWLMLTLSFEFLAGHYLFGAPWSKVLAEYDVLHGRIWILVPLITFGAPWLMAKARGY